MTELKPAQLGEQIPNTDLVRRFIGRREIYPISIKPRGMLPLSDLLQQAFDQALAAGFNGVVVEGDLYIHRNGEWYVWSLPCRKEPRNGT